MSKENELGDDCPHCLRVKYVFDTLRELGYDVSLEEVYMIDELFARNSFPNLVRILSDSEIIMNQYDNRPDEGKIIENYEKQIDEDDKEK